MKGNGGKYGESFEVDKKGLELMMCDGRKLLLGMLGCMNIRRGAPLVAAVTERWQNGCLSEDHHISSSGQGRYEV